MRKYSLVLKKITVALICGAVMSIAMTGCSKNEIVSNLAPEGKLEPPEWLIGTWNGDNSPDVFEVQSGSIRASIGDLHDLAKIANTNAATTGGSVKVKEIRKTDTEYEVGMVIKPKSGYKTTDSYYSFKKGDGTFIEVSKELGDFKRYNKEPDENP